MDSMHNRVAKSVWLLLSLWRKRWNFIHQGTEDIPCSICTAIIHDDDFVRNSIATQLDVEVFDGAGKSILFISSRDDYGQKCEVVWHC
jgi:hypothetical protein